MSNLDLISTNTEIALKIATQFKHLRKLRHISQKDLATQSGISYGSIKRFEQTGEVSFSSLIKLAQVLGAVDEFLKLFNSYEYKSIEEAINDK